MLCFVVFSLLDRHFTTSVVRSQVNFLRLANIFFVACDWLVEPFCEGVFGGKKSVKKSEKTKNSEKKNEKNFKNLEKT